MPQATLAPPGISEHHQETDFLQPSALPAKEMPQQESQSQTQVTINTKHLHHNITVHSLQPPLHLLDVFCSRTKNRLSSEGVAQSTADSEEHDALSGISWAALVQLSQLKPVSSQELSWGNLHTHTQYWELGSSLHYPATPSCG